MSLREGVRLEKAIRWKEVGRSRRRRNLQWERVSERGSKSRWEFSLSLDGRSVEWRISILVP